jgi:hypothetical protein
MCTEENTALNMNGLWQIIHVHRSTWQITSLSFLSRSFLYVIQDPIKSLLNFHTLNLLYCGKKHVTNQLLNLEYRSYIFYLFLFLLSFLPSFLSFSRFNFMKLQVLTAASSSHPSMKRRKCVKVTFIQFVLSFYFDVCCLQCIRWSSGYALTVQPSPKHKHSSRHACNSAQNIRSSSVQRRLSLVFYSLGNS